MAYDTPESLKEAVDGAGGVLTVKASDVRDAFGYGRLGIHVRAGIKSKLSGLGIAIYPVEVPDWQDEPLRLYRMGTPIADLIDAVLDPTHQHDDELRSAVSGGAAEVLDQVRALVCQ